jgi:hypothetical protein
VTLDEVQEERKKRSAASLARVDSALLAVASSTKGRELLEWLIYELGSLKSVGFNAEPALRDFLQGQRAVGHALEQRLMRVSRDDWAAMETARVERMRGEEPLPVPEDD